MTIAYTEDSSSESTNQDAAFTRKVAVVSDISSRNDKSPT